MIKEKEESLFVEGIDINIGGKEIAKVSKSKK